VQQASRYGILDSSHTNDSRILTDTLVHLLKGLAADELQLLTLKILTGSNVVE
jgi:hypothetical protein